MLLPWRDVPVGGGYTINTSLTRHEITRLRVLAHGQYVLEIGAAYGYSATQMAQTARHVLSVDPHRTHDLETCLRNFELHAPGSVTVMVTTSQQAMPMLRGIGATFGLIFIDGDHTEDAVFHDYCAALELVLAAGGGCIACHDYGEDTCPGVKVALDKCCPDGPTDLVDTLAVYYP